ncbi:putative sodium:solute symport protein [Candidatus Vecturithrix granuli]|uniref:Putative sodium:solute symport protein n=1 Tax=Vecturithrix granuli TaxID=1499967 RepID=A0A081C6Q7_VECG1|nr:putative sodium:solute symport protein [Candidatus Vecturithrix granuli]
MQWVQMLIIIAYFVLLAVVGKIMKKYAKSSSEFLIAGRNMGVTLVTVVIVGEWLGGMSTVGTSETAFQSGFFPLWYNVSTATGMFLFGLTIAATYRKHNVHTVGEMLQLYYNRQVRVVASLAFVVAFVIMSYLQLQAIGSLVSQLFGGMLTSVSNALASIFGSHLSLFEPYSIAIIISGIFVIFYVYEGGMKSIALTNLIHVILIFSTVITVFLLVLYKIGGYSGLFAALQQAFITEGKTAEQAAQTVASFKNPFSLGMGKVIAWILGGILSGFASQACIQPVFAAKDISTAKKSAIISAIFIAPLGILVSTMGMAVRSGVFGYIDVSRAKEALPFLLMGSNFLPPWLSGLAVAGILAAILSTVAPVMFAVSTILVKDFYHLIVNKDASDAHLLKVSKLLTVIVGLLTIPMAIYLQGRILEAAYITYGIRGSAAIVVLLGVFWLNKKTQGTFVTPLAASVSIIAATVGILIFAMNKNTITAYLKWLPFTLDQVHVAIFLTLAAILIVTPLTRKSHEESSTMKIGTKV